MNGGEIQMNDGFEIQMNDGFDMDEYERRLDEIVAEVVPADHPVHERLA